MKRLLFSSASLAFLAAFGAAQTYVQRYDAGTSYTGVSGNETLVQLSDADGNSRLVNGSGSLVHSNAGYSGALGVSDNGREFLGVSDPSAPLPASYGYIRQGGDSYPTILGNSGEYQGYLRGGIDPVGGKVAFLAFDASAGDFRWGIDTGAGPATPIKSDGTVAVYNLLVDSIAATGSFTGYGQGAAFEGQAFWHDSVGYHLLGAPGASTGFQSLKINQDAGGDAWLTAVVVEGAGTWGTAWSISGGVATWTGLKVNGALGVTEAWGGRSAFWTQGEAWTVDLSTGTRSDILTSGGGGLAGVTSGFARDSAFYLNGSFGAGTVQAVPEPATLAALGLGLAALSRRRRLS